MKVKIVQWNTVASWVWDLEKDDKLCAICQQSFENTCNRCKMPGDDCPPVQGECNHYFHLHCIIKNLEQNTIGNCPLCRKRWVEKTSI